MGRAVPVLDANRHIKETTYHRYMWMKVSEFLTQT